MESYTFKTEPYAHQREAFKLSHDKEFFALLMEMRTGKSKVVIDTASYLWGQGKIELLLVIAPNLVHRQWVDTEAPRHCPEPYTAVAWSSAWSPSKQMREMSHLEGTGGLVVFTINYEAVISKRGRDVITYLMERFDTMLVLDESHRIKTPSAKQTKAIIKLSWHAKYKRILTGTPVTQGPFDVYTQFNFLSPTILSCGSFFAFKNRYGVWEKQYAHGRSYQALVQYKNMANLIQMTRPHSFRVTAKECLDLPDRQYTQIKFELSPKQQGIYDNLCENLIAEMNGQRIEAPLALTKLLRLQQITGGFFPSELNNQIDYPNKRMEEAHAFIQNIPGKIIIWARFVIELFSWLDILGDAAVGVFGQIPMSVRVENIRRFQEDDEVKFLVANPAVAGEGLDLSCADAMMFYSCSFKLTERLQAEARCDHPERVIPVTVIDVIGNNTVDEHVIRRLRTKFDLAATFTGDELRRWIQ